MALIFRYPASRRCVPSLNGSRGVFIRSFCGSQQGQQAQVVDTPRANVPQDNEGPNAGPTITKFFKRGGAPRKADGSEAPPGPLGLYYNATVWIDSKKYVISPLVLRDLCTCPRCVDQSTRQKHFSTADIPQGIRAGITYPSPEVIHLKWGNDIPGYEGHESDLPVDLLRKIVNTGRTNGHERLPRTLWDSDTFNAEAEDVDYETYMNDDSVLLNILRQLHTHGLVFITDVPESESSVQNLAERIGPLKTTFYGPTWDVRSVPDAINIAYTAQNLGFHMDLMYMEQPPHLQLLHCIRSSASGGASLFSDSFKAAAHLGRTDIDAFRALAQKPVDFHYDHPGSQYYYQHRVVIEQKPRKIGSNMYPSWNELHRASESPGFGDLKELTKLKKHTGPEDFIDNISWAPPFQAPFSLSDGENPKLDHAGKSTNPHRLGKQVEAWHTAAKKFNDLIHRPEAIYERTMKPGECVVFDNRRVLHARRAFDVGDVGKERWLRGAYIDKDPYMSRLKTLTDLHRAKQKQGATSLKEETGKENYFEAISAA